MKTDSGLEYSIVILVHRLLPYHIARFEAANRKFGRIVVFEMSGEDNTYKFRDIDAPTTFRKQIVFSDRDVWTVNPFQTLKKVSRLLNEAKPTHVFTYGWFESFSLAALAWATRHKIPCIVIATSTVGDFSRSRLIEYFKGRLISCFSAAFVAGKRSRRYLAQLKFPKSKIFVGQNVVDNNHFGVGIDRTDGPPGRFMFLGRYVEKKNIMTLLHAYKDYLAKTGNPWGLTLYGSGPEEEAIRRLAGEISSTFVTVSGPVSYRDLPQKLRDAGALILPSKSEQWGLVVNEAMASGTPAIVSTECGCVSDLIEHQSNGWVCEASESESITSALLSVSSLSAEDWRGVSKNAQKTMRSWDLDLFVTGFSECTRAVRCAKTPRVRPILSIVILAIFSYRYFAGSAPNKPV